MFIFTLENINSIKDTVYTTDGVPKKHAEQIEYSKTKGLFKDFDYSKYFHKKPPKNHSMKTLQELYYLRDLPEDKDFVEKHDSIRDVMEGVCKEHGIKYPQELVNELKVSSAGIIKDLKYYYNRPRPYQLAKHYGIKLGEHILESMKTPSYPSGHSAQGILIGKVLQTKLPINTDAFIEAGNRISYSRNIGGAHYPSDSELGKIIGTRMYEYIIHKI